MSSSPPEEEAIQIAANGSIGICARTVASTSVGIDDATAENTVTSAQAYTNNATVPFGLAFNTTQGIGYHYLTLLGGVGGGATATWAAASTLTASVRM